MPIPIERPLLTRIYQGWEEFQLESGSAYIHGRNMEERSVHPSSWEQASEDVIFVRVSSLEDGTVKDFSRCTAKTNGVVNTLQLRGSGQLRDYVGEIEAKAIYIDITGLPHHVWAPLLKAALLVSSSISVVYVEPRRYTFSHTPTSAGIFDLSEAIHGIMPLPGFGVLVEPDNDDHVVFVPFLGFEGQRLAYVIEHVQPPIRNVFPVIGVPGFMPEFPFHAYVGNKNMFEHSTLHTQVYFGNANSAFDAFYVLQEIGAKYPQHLLKVAPIGTKPHALGAVLFALHSQRTVEIVYDHPIRKQDRTIGSGNILVYNVAELLSASSS